MVITIDGPASSGKSTAGLLLSLKINFQFIDSGLIYRIAAYLALKKKIDLRDEDKCVEILSQARIDFKTINSHAIAFLDGEDITALLKTPEIDKVVAVVAAMPKLREEAKKIQREIGLKQNTVIAGRDIGAEVFPESPLKFFITASLKVRARRRFNQQVKIHLEVNLENIEEEMKKRDEVDSTRKTSPMRIADDAFAIDTSDLNLNQVVEELLRIYKDKNLLPADLAPV